MTDCSNIIQFCKAGTQLPITREHNEFKDVNPHYFLESTSEGINQPILFKTFMIPVPIESGSVSSIEFLESLSYHEKFYQLKFIQDFLEWKWS